MYCFCIVRYAPKFVQKSTQSTASGRGNRTRQIWCQWWRGQQILKPSLTAYLHPLVLPGGCSAKASGKTRKVKAGALSNYFNFVGYSNHFPGPSNSFFFIRESKDSAKSVRSPEKYFPVSLLMLQTSSNTQNWTLKLLFLINPYFWQIHTRTDDLHHYRFLNLPRSSDGDETEPPSEPGDDATEPPSEPRMEPEDPGIFRSGAGMPKKVCTLPI